MADLTLNDSGTARVALEEVWRQLAPIIEEARKLQMAASRDPLLWSEPWVVVHDRWLTVFERELAAVQKVYEAIEAGPRVRLATEDVRAAVEAGEKLLSIISQARERIPQPEPAAQAALF